MQSAGAHRLPAGTASLSTLEHLHAADLGGGRLLKLVSGRPCAQPDRQLLKPHLTAVLSRITLLPADHKSHLRSCSSPPLVMLFIQSRALQTTLNIALTSQVATAAKPICHTKPSTVGTDKSSYQWGSSGVPFPSSAPDIKAAITATFKDCTSKPNFDVSVELWAGSADSESLWTGSFDQPNVRGGRADCAAGAYSLWKDINTGAWTWQKTCV